MADVIQVVPVHLQYLVSPSQTALLGGSARLVNGLDVDRQIPVGAAVAADDGEAKALIAALQDDLPNRAGGKGRTG